MDFAAQDVPDRDHVLGAGFHFGQLGQATGCDYDHVGFKGEHVFGFGQNVVAHLNTQALQLSDPPVDDASEVSSPGIAHRQHDLAPRPRHCLEQGHVVAALACDPCSLETGGSGPDHDHPLLIVGPGHLVGHRGLAPCGGVVYAERLAGLVDAVQAVGGTYAGSDLLLTCLDDLGNDVRVGNVGPGHADQVDQPFRDCVSGR